MVEGPGRIFVALVVVALFFCHGVFGYAHQASPSESHGPHTAHATTNVHQPSSDRGMDEGHLGDVYFATLLALLFGTSLLLVGGMSADAKFVVPVVSRRESGPRALPPPRGPTPSSLQVFRL